MSDTYSRIKKDIVTLAIAYLFITLLWVWLPVARDNTDGKNRSGMLPHVDALTGCEYLSVRGGGITPRLDVDGKQICAGAGK